MKNQFMPMFWGDFLANTMHLTATEVGAYALLIGHAWEHEGRILIADAQRIARIPDNRTWARIRPRLERFFDPVTRAGGLVPAEWCSQRVTAELGRAAEISNKRKDAALQKHSKSYTNGGANAGVLHPHTILQNIESSFSEEVRDAKPMQMQTNFRDKGVDYRAPPAQKSDNDLDPASRDDLKALSKRR